MGDFEASVVLPRGREETFEYLCNPVNFLKLFPESATKHVDIKIPEMLFPGARLEFNFKVMGSPIRILQEITDLSPNERIIATQLAGPFSSWVHEQRFADATGGTLLTNSVKFEPPGGLMGFIVTRKLVISHLEEWVGRGHELLRESLENESP